MTVLMRLVGCIEDILVQTDIILEVVMHNT